MEGEEGGGFGRLKDDKNKGIGEVDYKTKSGTAWSHSYLNQKPWHPLSYPNQRRKWIAEQTHANHQRRQEEVTREYAQEQEFFRQTSLISKKEKEKIEMMKAVSFMYVRPPGYNAESAKAAEVADEMKQNDQQSTQEQTSAMQSSSTHGSENRDPLVEGKKKPRPKDVFGRPLPTEEEFQVLKNAPRLETGLPARVKPFGIELRNVKCVRCGNFGHQSGDRECPLKDAIMPNEEERLKRDDPLTTIVAQTDPFETLKWELKQKPGMSPPRGGFDPDDPNQQIVAEEIFDEYGGFLSGGNIPDLLTNFPPSTVKSRSKKKKRNRERSSSRELEASEQDESPLRNRERSSKKVKKRKEKEKKKKHSLSSLSDDSEFDRDSRKRRSKRRYSSEDSESDRIHSSKSRGKRYHSTEESKYDRSCRRDKKSKRRHSSSSSEEESPSDRRHRSETSRHHRSRRRL